MGGHAQMMVREISAIRHAIFTILLVFFSGMKICPNMQICVGHITLAMATTISLVTRYRPSHCKKNQGLI